MAGDEGRRPRLKLASVADAAAVRGMRLIRATELREAPKGKLKLASEGGRRQ
ncbi:MAG: hypothetical protein JRD89_07120 [Deltaproteobacteria bacterium]|nr:hypothetical protein [Deltaproteobacteria bacterium]